MDTTQIIESQATLLQRTFLGVSIDAIFTTFTAILVFVIGFILNRLYETYKENKRLDELENYFYSLIKSLMGPIEKQTEMFKKLSESIADKEEQTFAFNQATGLYFDNITNISHLDLYKIFITRRKLSSKDKMAHFQNIFDSIEFVRFQMKVTQRNFWEFFQDYRRYEQEWDKNGDAILRFFDSVASEAKAAGVKPSQDPFLKEMDVIIHSWSKRENSKNIYVAKEHLLDPLKQHCAKENQDPRSRTLMPIIVQAKYAFNNINQAKELYSKYFQEESNNLRNQKELIQKALEFFRQSGK